MPLNLSSRDHNNKRIRGEQIPHLLLHKVTLELDSSKIVDQGINLTHRTFRSNGESISLALGKSSPLHAHSPDHSKKGNDIQHIFGSPLGPFQNQPFSPSSSLHVKRKRSTVKSPGSKTSKKFVDTLIQGTGAFEPRHNESLTIEDQGSKMGYKVDFSPSRKRERSSQRHSETRYSQRTNASGGVYVLKKSMKRETRDPSL